MRLILIAVTALMLSACADIEIDSDIVPLTSDEVAAGLRDALSRGISRGAAQAGSKGGYLNNPQLKIEFPPDAKKVADTLRKIGFGDEVDRFVVQLNQGAERAAAKAKPIFIRVITQMSISDAFDILNGEQDAATRYLERTAGDDLYDAFLPIVQKTLDETSATRNYSELVERFNDLPLTFNVDPDLDEYATEKAIEGLFKLIAKEEAAIRANPRSRTTKLLRRVFGSLD